MNSMCLQIANLISKPLRDVFGSDVVYPDCLDYASEKCEFKLLYDILKICE